MNTEKTPLSHAFCAEIPAWSHWEKFLPCRPLCGDLLTDGLCRRPLPEAIARWHFEANTAGRVSALCLDLDRPDGATAWEDVDLPAPTVVIQNPSNGHAHAAWTLRSPVPLTDAARPHPCAYLAAVERGMTRRLGAEPRYGGRLIKSPFSSRWRTLWLSPEPFNLEDLACRLTVAEMKAPERRTEISGIGRNVDLFDAVRTWAYRHVRDAKRGGLGPDAWRAELMAVAAEQNTFDCPLGLTEVRGIAKSVAKWTWTRFSEGAFSMIQARRAEIGGEQRRKLAMSRAALMADVDAAQANHLYLDMAGVLPCLTQPGRPGMTARIARKRTATAAALALQFGVNVRTVRRDLAEPRADYLARRLARSRPWEAEGISRATWYRRRAARGIKDPAAVN